jgi:hypothetical protein
MPGKKRPTDEEAATARRALLDGLARDADIFEVLSGLAPLHPRNDTFPGEVLLLLAADALEWCGASRAEPLALEGCASGTCPNAPSADGRTPSCSTRSWRGSRPRRDRNRTAGGGRLHPRRREPGGRPSPPSMPGPQLTPRRTGSLPTRSGSHARR